MFLEYWNCNALLIVSSARFLLLIVVEGVERIEIRAPLLWSKG